MKNTTQIFNKETASRFSKSFKKNLTNIGFDISLSQCQDILAKSVGFPNYQSALKSDFKFKNLKKQNYIVTFDSDINDMEYIFNKNKYCFLFIGFDNLLFNFYEISKVIDLYDFEPSETSMQLYLNFLKKASDVFYADKHIRSLYYSNVELNIFFSHDEEDNPNDQLFKQEDFIKLFDSIFENEIFLKNEIGFLSGHVKTVLNNFKISTITESEKDRLIELNIPNKIIYK